MEKIAWGKKVSQVFLDRVRWIVEDLQIGQNTLDGMSSLMTCMAWESGRSFSPSKKNLAGSGATGLIQFMPDTATKLGTSVEKLAQMTAEAQLNYVWKYFAPWKGQLKTLGDIYMAILWPKAVGKPESYPLWAKGTMPTTYRQNAGLDTNKDGQIIKAEATAKLTAMLIEGLKDQNASGVDAKKHELLGIHINLNPVGDILGDVVKGVVKTTANAATGGVLGSVINDAVDKVGAEAFNHGKDDNHPEWDHPVVTEEKVEYPTEAGTTEVVTTTEPQTTAVTVSKAISGWQGNFAGIAAIAGALLLNPDFTKAVAGFTMSLSKGEGSWGALIALVGVGLVAYKHRPNQA